MTFNISYLENLQVTYFEQFQASSVSLLEKSIQFLINKAKLDS